MTAFQDAVQSANRYAPPVPSNEPPVHPLLIAGGGAACCWSTSSRARCAGSRSPGCRC